MSNKPREFWICLRCNYFFTSKRSTCNTSDCYSLNLVHVIEYSAYEHLQQKLEIAKKELADAIETIHCNECHDGSEHHPLCLKPRLALIKLNAGPE